MVAFARSVVRCPCTRSTGCRRMPQLGTKVTTGPLRMKASLVWICKRLASTQNTSRARPTSNTGSGLLARLELLTTLESAERTFFAMMGLDLLLCVGSLLMQRCCWNVGVIKGGDVAACQEAGESAQLHAQGRDLLRG